DHTFYTSWNALAASAYLEASWTLDRPELREAALQALDFAWENCRRTGDGQTAMYRYYDGSPHIPGLLGDQAYTARALLDAHEASGDSAYLGRAEELARLLLDRFADKDGGGFFDVWEEADSLGRLAERQKSVQDNAVCSELFIRLHHLTRSEEYKRVAQATLEAFSPSYHTLGYFAAGYAKQVDLLLNPPAEVNIVGTLKDDGVRALHLAALSLDLPYRVVQLLDPERDVARLAALSLPPEPAPAAYVCLGTTCSAPVTDPAALTETVEKMRSADIQTLE
ncbi:MAG: thioredoxin domain-containing protein, partial [Chloroflexi bacterium]|nr:thioredoxin domain-containing protein [Chloroflexota bacterium]